MHFAPLVILFAFIGGDTFIECYLSNIYVEKLGTGMQWWMKHAKTKIWGGGGGAEVRSQ